MEMAKKHREYKFLVERMHFSNPYFFISYFLIGCAIYLLFSYLGGFVYEILTHDLLLYGGPFIFPYVAFAVKDTVTRINQYLAIHPNESKESPLRALFASENDFRDYRDAVLKRISSWEIPISVLCLLVLASATIIYDVFITHNFGKPWDVENAGIWGILIFSVNYYAWWWILGIAGFGFAGVLYCLIGAIKRIEQTEGLRITESIKTLKALTTGEENDRDITKKILKGHYSHTKFLIDYEKITGFTSLIAVRIAFIAILYSFAYIAIGGLFYKNWILPLVGFTIILDVIAIWVFITPLISAHRLLKRTKKEIYTTISDVYEQHKLRFLNKSASFSPVKSSMVKDIELLKKMADETGDLRTWPVEIGDTLRLTAAAVISLSPFIVQKLISF